jgi:hypothetical protein
LPIVEDTSVPTLSSCSPSFFLPLRCPTGNHKVCFVP